MRIVLDTNVLVSGLLNPNGPPGRIVDMVFLGDLTPLVDDRIIGEYEDVLSRRKFGFAPGDVRAIMFFFKTEAEHVVPAPLALKLKDPADLPFIEVAVSGLADALVTGNAKHFTFHKKIAGFNVISSVDLIARLAEL